MSVLALDAARKLVPKGGSGGNMALAFGALVAGGVVLDYGLKAFSGATSAAAAGGASGASGGASGAGSSSAGGSPVATPAGSPTVIANSGYTNPLQHVTTWERTDQGVDASMPAGSPIVAPGKIKILGIEPDWYSGQPFIYWQLLDGPDKGQVQYVAEQITDLASVGSTLNAGDPIAKFASSGTGIEMGWATSSGQTLAIGGSAQGVDGKSGVYTEGYATTAGNDFRKWLNSVGANAGTGAGLSIGAGADPDDAAAALLAQKASWKRDDTTPGYTYTPPTYHPTTDPDDDDDDDSHKASDDVYSYDGDT